MRVSSYWRPQHSILYYVSCDSRRRHPLLDSHWNGSIPINVFSCGDPDLIFVSPAYYRQSVLHHDETAIPASYWIGYFCASEDGTSRQLENLASRIDYWSTKPITNSLRTSRDKLKISNSPNFLRNLPDTTGILSVLSYGRTNVVVQYAFPPKHEAGGRRI